MTPEKSDEVKFDHRLAANLINLIHRILADSGKSAMALVEIGTISLPTERYKRNVVRGRLDLVGE